MTDKNVRGLSLLFLYCYYALTVRANPTISANQSSPAVFQAGDNVTLTCTGGNGEYSWSTSFTDSDGNAVSKSGPTVTGIYVHGADTGLHTCTSNSQTASYMLTVKGTNIWYNNPVPGHLLLNNTAISVYSMINEIRCYTGDTSSNNIATTIITPTNNSPLQFSTVNHVAGVLKKTGTNDITSVANGVYTCRYNDSTGNVSETSFAIYSRDREPNAINATSLEVQSVQYSIVGQNIAVTCISTGWPATQVIWTKDNVMLTEGANSHMKQTVLDRTMSMYKNELLVDNSPSVLGTYRCQVKSIRHNDDIIDTAFGSVTVQTAGSIMVAVTTTGSLDVGESYILNCTVKKPENGTLTIEWMKDNVTVVGGINGTTLGALEENNVSYSKVLTLSPVRLSHSGLYSCVSRGESNVGKATIQVDVEVPLLSVSLEPTDSVITLGTTVSLQCSISLPDTLTATIQSIKWYKDSKLVTTGVDTMIAQGISTYDLDTVLSAEAGNYTCVMEITSPYIDNGVQLIVSNTTDLTVLLPNPDSLSIVFNLLLSPFYAGTRRILQCRAIVDTFDDPNVNVNMNILHNGNTIPESFRYTLSDTSRFGTSAEKSIDYLYLTLSDSGNYTCTISVSSTLSSSYVSDVFVSTSEHYTIQTPIPNVTLSSTSTRVPLHTNYSSAILNCTGIVPLGVVGRLSILNPKQFSWTRNSVDITSSAVTDQNSLYFVYGYSTVSATYTTAGDYTYLCTVSISVMGDPTVSRNDSLTITVTGPSAPNTPINITSTDIRYNAAVINWLVTNISYTPEQYIVYYGLTSTALTNTSTVLYGTEDFSDINKMLSIELVDLIFNTDYYYIVSSTNTEGTANSSIGMFRTKEKPPTAPPESFVMSAINSTAILFQWELPPVDQRNGIITRYTLNCQEYINQMFYSLDASFPLNIYENTSISLVINEFRPGTLISCTVTSSNEAGTGPPAYFNISTVEQAPGGPPLSFLITSTEAREFTVIWSPPDPFLQYGVITGYLLTCNDSETNMVAPSFPRLLTTSPAIVDELRPFTSYNCSLVAVNNAGVSKAVTYSAMTEPDAPEGAPLDFTVTVLNSKTVELSWLPVLEALQNGMIINYTVGCNTSDMITQHVEEILEMTNARYSSTIDDLLPYTVYECYVFANTTEGSGPSAVGIVRTSEEAPGGPPLNILLIPQSPYSITIKWLPPAQPNGYITQYTIYINYMNTTVSSVNVPRPSTQYTVTGLSPYQSIMVQVSAWTAVGEGPISESVSDRTEQAIPGQVIGIRLTPLSHNSLLVSFNDQPLSVANGIILGYEISIIQYTGNGSLQFKSVDVNNTIEESFDGLIPFVPYNVTVVAINGAGRGIPTILIAFTAEKNPPSPNDVDVNRINGTTMRVSWTLIPITEANGIISNYYITYAPIDATRDRQSTTVSVPGNESSVTIGGLGPGLTYSVIVGATNGAGNGLASDPKIAEPPTTEDSSLIIIIAGAAGGVAVIIIIVIIIIIIIVVVSNKRKPVIETSTYLDPLGDFESSSEKVELTELTQFHENGDVKEKEKEMRELEESIKTPEPVSLDERLKPIPRSAFSQHVKEMHRERDKGFELEYQSLNVPTFVPHEAAKMNCNRPKNRFANIYPYDFSRVVLSEQIGVEGSDYINASYMDGYNKANAYIAAQGPLQNTLSDFWRMIWEHRLDTVIMLTKCIEAGKRKCEMYWPEKINECLELSNGICITLTSITPFADYELRHFRVQHDNEPHMEPIEVTQWHYLGWPDHGCPQYATSLISFIRQFHKTHKKDGSPVLVHCSAGVGRTGTFIVLDSILERLIAEDTINVYEFLRQMRTKRVFMVQTLAQYVFIHDAVDELITCGETDIPIASLKQKIAYFHKIIPGKGYTSFDNQFHLLDIVSRKPVEIDCADALQAYNRQKNRYPDRVPYNISRVRLRPTGGQGSEYMNASFVDGYKLRNAYIATQGPLQTTVHDFWRMIWEFKSRCIVLLSNLEENGVEVCYQYWPNRVGEPLQFNKLIVTLQSEMEKLGGYVMRKLEIKEDKAQPASFVVTQFHFKEWEEHSCPGNSPGILTMLEDVNKTQRNTGNKPITVMCNDGQGRTGTFICIHAQQDRLKTEGVVDVFHFIKSMRIQRSRMVSDLEQYIFCHQVLQDYYEKFNVYSNFK